jgi:hypothetical protein
MYEFLDVGLPTGIQEVEGSNHIAFKEWIWPSYAPIDMSLCGEINNKIGISYHFSAELWVRDISLDKFVSWATSNRI